MDTVFVSCDADFERRFLWCRDEDWARDKLKDWIGQVCEERPPFKKLEFTIYCPPWWFTTTWRAIDLSSLTHWLVQACAPPNQIPLQCGRWSSRKGASGPYASQVNVHLMWDEHEISMECWWDDKSAWIWKGKSGRFQEMILMLHFEQSLWVQINFKKLLHVLVWMRTSEHGDVDSTISRAVLYCWMVHRWCISQFWSSNLILKSMPPTHR